MCFRCLTLYLAPGSAFPPTELSRSVFRSMQAVSPEAEQAKNCLPGLYLFPTSPTPTLGFLPAKNNYPNRLQDRPFSVNSLTCTAAQGKSPRQDLCEELTFGGLITAVTLPLPDLLTQVLPISFLARIHQRPTASQRAGRHSSLN